MGTLLIVSTPIGNLQDISLRAARTLLTSSVIACEDTRRTGILLKEISKLFSGFHEEIKPKLISYYDQVEIQKIPEIVEILNTGTDVVLVSDAGTPGISDPGFKLIRECIKKEIKVEAIPGPSSVITSLVVSGLPTDKFFFLGYPPKKEGHRNEFWKNIVNVNSEIKTTFILFEAPHRIIGTIDEMINIFGEEFEVVFARELTKIYEEVLRFSLRKAKDHFSKIPPKGEFVILFNMQK
ncbi:MAG TPA: 16S rRNA (cytidine(1402)-2'-O)-methyltransferase [Patescibacteria group bacterium]